MKNLFDSLKSTLEIAIDKSKSNEFYIFSGGELALTQKGLDFIVNTVDSTQKYTLVLTDDSIHCSTTQYKVVVQLNLKPEQIRLVSNSVEFDFEIAVMVARSAHGQAVTWAPTQTIQSDGICTSTISPAPDLPSELSEKAQHLALSIANELSLIGVMAVEMFVKGDELFINELAMRPHNSGHWTIEGAKTSQFEQHLRTVLDLPLGDPSMVAGFAVMGNILGGDKTDMYRPYLHLMARNPNLKFHQYRKEIRKGRKIGHVTVVGENLLELTEVIAHARDYMSGEIDE